MELLFLICAAVGGTILLIQFALTMFGMGDFHAGDTDVHVDFHGDVPHDVLHDVPIDMAHDAPSAIPADDVPHHDQFHTDHMDVPDAGPSPSFLSTMVNFRSLVAAVTFFGLAGMLGMRSSLGLALVLLISVTSGLAAMLVVAWMMSLLYRLGEENTAHIEGALGKLAKVYLPVPSSKAGQGKVLVNVQNRTMEYLAVTPYEGLPAGSSVLITNVVDPYTVEVVEAPDVEDL